MEANEILVLDEGKVIERGLHEDLIKSGGLVCSNVANTTD